MKLGQIIENVTLSCIEEIQSDKLAPSINLMEDFEISITCTLNMDITMAKTGNQSKRWTAVRSLNK